jgi:hypothetical protein
MASTLARAAFIVAVLVASAACSVAPFDENETAAAEGGRTASSSPERQPRPIQQLVRVIGDYASAGSDFLRQVSVMARSVEHSMEAVSDHAAYRALEAFPGFVVRSFTEGPAFELFCALYKHALALLRAFVTALSAIAELMHDPTADRAGDGAKTIALLDAVKTECLAALRDCCCAELALLDAVVTRLLAVLADVIEAATKQQ